MDDEFLRKRFCGAVMERGIRFLVAPAFSLCLLLSIAAPVFAHGLLLRSVPANGAQLMALPRELRLTFSESVDLTFVRLELVGPTGAPVALGGLHHGGDSASVVVAGISGSLASGAYTVSWQAVGRDGHPTRGRISFVILEGAEGLVAEPAPQGLLVAEDTMSEPAGAAVTLAITPALSGHALSAPVGAGIAVVADAAHVLGAGGWLGSLLVLVAVGIPAAWRLDRESRGPAVAALVHAFSPTALIFAGVVVVTGIFASWQHVGSFQVLWTSDYGRLLLLKLAVLSLVFGTGAYNFLRVRPVLGGEAGVNRLRRASLFELVIGAVVVVITAVLVATPPPGETQDELGAVPEVEVHRVTMSEI